MTTIVTAFVPANRDAEEFRRFLDRHLRELGRLAFLLTGDSHAADDLTSDTLMQAWSRWDRVQRADSPQAYVRGMMIHLASNRIRRLMRERSRLVLLWADAVDAARSGPDVPAAVDLHAALRILPRGQRACVVLRHGLGLSEAETAATLGVSVGTVKSQTSKGAAALRRRLAPDDDSRSTT